MYSDIASEQGPSPARQRFNLTGLVATLALGAFVLYRLSGPPHVPTSLPTLRQVTLALASSAVPYGAFVYLLTTAAWLIWLWLVGSLLLRLLVVIAETMGRGTAWVRSLRVLSDRLTLPLVRRLVDGAVATATVVQLVSRATPLASAAPLPPHPTPIMAQAIPPTMRHAGNSSDVTYTVQADDNLWVIAERFYGDGEAYPRIVAANVGQPMPDGSRFARAGVIRSGWVLRIPDATRSVAPAVAQAHTIYVVQDGDTLRAIAAHFYGDEMRWPEIYRANEGATAGNGLDLTNPDRIWPGLRLVIPGVSPTPVTASAQVLPATHPRVIAPAVIRPPAPVAARTRKPVAHPPTAAPVKPAPPATPAPTASAPIVRTVPPADHDVRPPSRPTAKPGTPSPMPRVRPTAPRATGANQSTKGGELIVLGFGGVAVVGAASLLARRRSGRPFAGPPIEEEDALPVDAGFAAAAAAHVVATRATPEDVEPAVLVASQTLRLLGEAGVPNAQILFLRQGRRSAAVTVACALEDRQSAVALAPELARRLGGSGQASLTRHGDVTFTFTRLDALGLLLPSVESVPGLTLLPLGVLPNRQLLYAPWQGLGHLLIAGAADDGCRTILTSLLGALVSRRPPEQLQLHLMVPRHALAEPLLGLPHVVSPPVDPANAAAVDALLSALREELERRMAQGAPVSGACQPWPDHVLVVDDLATLNEQGEALDALLLHGPTFGIRVVAVTTRPMAIDDATLRHLETRLVLHVAREDESILLLGHPNAADIGSGGAMLAQITGREDIRLRGFRISDDHLGYLLRTMERERSSALSTPPAAAGLPDAPDPSAPAIPESPASPSAPADVGSTTEPAPLPVMVSDSTMAQDEEAAAGSEAPEVIDAPAPKSDEESAATLAEATPELHAVGDDQTNPAAAEPPLDEDSKPGSEVDGTCGPDIRIQCFGAFRVLCDRKEMKPEGGEYNMYRPWEVLAYLAIQPPGPISRRRLIDDIWADWDEVEAEKIYARVRTVLARIRKVFERQVPELREPVVSLDRNGMVTLNLRVVHSEAHEFLELVRSSATLPSPQAMDACRQARALYRGDLLADCQYEWLFSPAAPSGSEQQVYRQKYRTVTARLAQLHAEQGQLEQAVTLYRQILRDDAGNEKVACRLFECRAQIGDITALQRDYRWLDHTVREQYRSRLGPKVVSAYEAAIAALSGEQANSLGSSVAPSAS